MLIHQSERSSMVLVFTCTEAGERVGNRNRAAGHNRDLAMGDQPRGALAEIGLRAQRSGSATEG